MTTAEARGTSGDRRGDGGERRRGLRLYRLALRALPRRFRRAWGDGMIAAADVKLERAAARGRIRWLSRLAALLVDALLSALLVRLRRDEPPGSQAKRRGLPEPAPRTRFRRSPRPPMWPKGIHMPNRLLSDVRAATRALARQPLLSGLILVILTLGAGGTIAFFGIVDAAVLRPLPYPEAGRLVALMQSSERFGLYGWAPPFLADLRERTRSYEELIGFSPTWSLTMTGVGEPQRVAAAFVSDGALALFGARPVAGRLFGPEDHVPGGPPVALVSATFWERHFGGEARAGRESVTLDGTRFEVVGVLADGLRMPITTSAVSQRGESAEVWLPFARNPYAATRRVPVMDVVGRLRAGASDEVAAAELASVASDLTAEYPQAGLSERPALVPLAELVSAGPRGVILLLFGAAATLLLIACANVANLLLVRASGRSEELAIRASIGASRARLVEQLLAENGMLAVLGTGGGLLLATWLLRILPALGLLELPPSAVVRLDARVAAFSFALTLITTLLFGLAPALQATRASGSLTTGPGTRVVGGAGRRLRATLVVLEVALALVLLAGAGLLARSFWTLSAVDPGFAAERVLVVPLGLGGDRFALPANRRLFLSALADDVSGLPGVERVAAVNRVPLSGGNVFVDVEIEGGAADGEEAVTMDRRVATPGYFEALRIPLLAGRDFGPADTADAGEPVALVNETARAMFPGGDPVGMRARLRLQGGPGPWLRIVGVVGDIRHHGLAAPAEPEIYVPYEQASVTSMDFLVRTDGDPESLAAAVKARVWNMDDEMPLDGTRPLQELLTASVAEPRTRMLLMEAFAAVALTLAGVGIAGVVSYAVARRSRDYGVRMALGARRGDVLRLALLEGLVPGAVGAGLGVLAAVALSRFLASLLYATSPTDPATLAGVCVLLLGIVAAASWLPARRATRVDPVVVLRDG